LLGIVEAKKVSVNPKNVLEQAKRYAAGTFHGVGNWDGLRVAFLYASNGEIIWYLDVRPEKRVSRQIKGFHSPKALKWLFEQDSTPAVDWLGQTPPDQIGRLRSYQRKVKVSSTVGCPCGGSRSDQLGNFTGEELNLCPILEGVDHYMTKLLNLRTT
jgi:type I site-specific restriction endonuclease